MSNTTVQNLFRYPVKSMAGESLESMTFTTRGGVGDRVWALRDEVRGGIRGAKKIPQLMQFAARLLEAPVEGGSNPALIEAPDGQTCRSDADNISVWLSEKLEHEVSLWPLLPPDALDHYRRGAPDQEDMEQELRAIFGRAPDQPLPDMSVFSEEVVEFESPPGTYFDVSPILLMSQQAMDALAAHRPESNFDVRRFRPNILVNVEGTDHPFPESQWLGKKLTIGEVVIEPDILCPRCVMTTLPFADLPKDPGVMRALVETNGNGDLGVYARVIEAGEIGVGDTLEIIA